MRRSLSHDFFHLQLGLAETYSPLVPFFREAEIRHGRTAMLAVCGFITADLQRIPGDLYSFDNIPHAYQAHDALLKEGPMIQLVGAIALFDLIITAPAISATMNGEREPGGKIPACTMFSPVAICC